MERHPLVEEVFSPLAAAEAFELFQECPFSFFLDSGMDPQKLGRYSFMGSEPFLVLRSRGREISILKEGREEIREGNPFDVLGELLQVYESAPCSPFQPLAGGAVGYFSYDLCHFIEHLPSTAIDDLQLPECYFAFYDLILAFDHLEGKTYIVSTGFPELEERERGKRARARLEEMKERLKKALLTNSNCHCDPFASCHSERSEESHTAQDRLREAIPPALHQDCFPRQVGVAMTNKWSHIQGIALRSNFNHEEYLQAVEAVREYIAAGDIYQVNLSQRFEADLPIPPYELYRRLRWINPAPFAAYLNFDGVTVVSASPERFLRLQGDLVETRPIKGTRPRGKTKEEDNALAWELVHSVKDKAEHVMIVDLERNDLGRVCRFGTVKVRELMTLETYATVFHLTSTVEGRLRRGKKQIDLLKACFPGGSITGAPKVRSMEIIDKLEPTRRSIYTGSIGYLSFSGELDLSIVIRTILVKGKRAYFQVGGGIVYDSDPEAEYQETLDKAKALFQALVLSPELEVVKWSL